jgi:predicted metalloprotease with PDZ domain
MTSNKQAIHYTIKPVNPAAHLFQVTCEIRNPASDGQQLWLPAWIPGSYMIRDFARNIVTLEARDTNGNVEVEKLDKQTWQCAPANGALTIVYSVYAWDLSVRGAHLDTTHGFFNGTSVFLAVTGREFEAVTVQIQLPDGAEYESWRVATTLTPVDTSLFSAGTYAANDYDELIDHPVEMGNVTVTEFDVAGTPHHIVITGRHQTDMQRLTQDIKQICETHVSMFGELPEMARYMFLLMVVGEGYGGLEHRSSTALICNRKDLPTRHMSTVSDDYITLLGLFSHEYFHTWNVKRIKPVEFVPYQLKEESYTRQLWAFEGITSYYDDLALVRSGIIDESKYLELLGKNFTRVLRGSGRLKQSLRESSFEAWSKFYKQDENSPNAIVSYYVKGAMFALALDLKIRELTKNNKSLDDIMRRLWREYGKQARGVEEDTILQMTNELVEQSLQAFFDRYLDTSDDIPLQAMLETMGISMNCRVASSYDDTGGKPAKTDNNNVILFNLGARFVADPQGVKLLVLHDDGDLQKAGLAANDIIIAIDGLKVTKDNITALLGLYSAGDSLNVHAFRRDELMTFDVALSDAKKNTWYMEISEDQQMQTRRQSWLQNSVDDNITRLQQPG